MSRRSVTCCHAQLRYRRLTSDLEAASTDNTLLKSEISSKNREIEGLQGRLETMQQELRAGEDKRRDGQRLADDLALAQAREAELRTASTQYVCC